jgi:hypothetical protein
MFAGSEKLVLGGMMDFGVHSLEWAQQSGELPKSLLTMIEFLTFLESR